MKPVKSSSISHVGHDPETNVLSVKFRAGQTYQYAGVTADKAAKMLAADSVGSHFVKHIKGSFRQVTK